MAFEEKIPETEVQEEYAKGGGTVADQLAELSGIEATATSSAAWLICCAVSLGGFLFGYDTGYISSVLVTIGTSLGHVLSAGEQELVTSLCSAGALVGAIFAGLTADKWGRKTPIWCACVVFVIGTVLQTAAYGMPQFAVGRFVVGLGVGAAAMVVPLYIGELAPAKYRGRMIAFNNMSVTFGQFVASSIGAGFAQVKGEGWRATVGIGALPAILLAGLLFMCPESPRQLVAHGKVEQADAVLQRIYKTSTVEQRLSKIKAIEMSIHEATSDMQAEPLTKSLKRIFTTPATGRAVLTTCTIASIAQLGGFSALMFYAATLFKLVGFANPTAVGITISATNFVFSFLAITLVDTYGRRAILRVTVLGMAVTMLVAAIAFHWIPIDTNTLELKNKGSVGWPGNVVLACMIIYTVFFTTGVAPLTWIGTELIPMEVRAVGTMLSTATTWSTNIIISSTVLSMMKGMTPSGTFGFYCGICFIGWVFIMFCYPECKGMPLEVIRSVFQHGFGVRYSKQWQRENRHTAKVTTQSFGH